MAYWGFQKYQAKVANFAPRLGNPTAECFQLQGANSPPEPLTRGSAPGPRWRLCLQTLVIIGSRSALAMSPIRAFCPPHYFRPGDAPGKRGHLSPQPPPSSGNVVKCFCALVVTTKRSVDELFMLYFHNQSSPSGGEAFRLHRYSISGPARWGTFVPKPVICPPLEKILRAPMYDGLLCMCFSTFRIRMWRHTVVKS